MRTSVHGQVSQRLPRRELREEEASDGQDEVHGLETPDGRAGARHRADAHPAEEEGTLMGFRPVPKITAEQENFRTVPLASGPGFNAVMTQRDPVEPVPIGTYVAMVFRVTGYDPDCDGSLMARLEQVDKGGEPTGWEPTHLGLYPDVDIVLDEPCDLFDLLETR
jgi:hypothetical protein